MNIKKAAESTRAEFESIRHSAIDTLEKAVKAAMDSQGVKELDLGEKNVFCNTSSEKDDSYFRSFFYDNDDNVSMMLECDGSDGNNFSADISELTFDQAVDLLDHIALTYGGVEMAGYYGFGRHEDDRLGWKLH